MASEVIDLEAASRLVQAEELHHLKNKEHAKMIEPQATPIASATAANNADDIKLPSHKAAGGSCSRQRRASGAKPALTLGRSVQGSDLTETGATLMPPTNVETFVLDADIEAEIRKKAVQNLDHYPRKSSLHIPGSDRIAARRDSIVRFDETPLLILPGEPDDASLEPITPEAEDDSVVDSSKRFSAEDGSGDIEASPVEKLSFRFTDSLKIKRNKKASNSEVNDSTEE